jgi:hypothetical protein
LDILNKILKNNGYLDADQINEDIQNLKDQINILLSEVLGVEHEIDGIHSYDDTDIKSRLDTNPTSKHTSRRRKYCASARPPTMCMSWLYFLCWFLASSHCTNNFRSGFCP